MASFSLVVIYTKATTQGDRPSHVVKWHLTRLIVLSRVALSLNPCMQKGHLWVEWSFSRDLRKKDWEPYAVEMFLWVNEWRGRNGERG